MSETLNNADTLAKVTGASKVTYTVEKRNADGTLETISTEESGSEPKMTKKPTMEQLEKLASIALRAQIKHDAAKAELEKAKKELMLGLMDAGMFNKDTKAIGNVQTNITPNRYFDVDTALTLVTPEDIEESTVEVIDNALLKKHMTPIQLEKAMKDYEVPFKLGLKPLVLDN